MSRQGKGLGKIKTNNKRPDPQDLINRIRIKLHLFCDGH